ncbi:MAG: DUF4202 domain-containing protein [Acidobacteria bacterium]|nr:DUF4202 domain-containing protein [Acidobacteriota bacterium]MDA1233560.1 DUF4202 domain-containing protein [Acidobacteriota bacterium]
MSDAFERAIAAIDALNAQDPRQDPYEAGQPYEAAYSQRMTRRLEALEPAASEALRLAARAQHVARWRIPRTDYPMDRAGYKRWRTDLATMHAQTTGEIMRDAGYGDEAIGRVQSLLKKKNLKTDPECQVLEDAICLVFLESYFADFAAQHDEEKLIRILQRTWAKMSERGHEAALKLPLSAEIGRLLKKALSAG